jgi:hypothetical protein
MRIASIRNELRDAFRETLAERGRRGQMAAIAVVVFALFVLVPVWTTPGNDVLFQLGLFTPSLYALIVTLSVLNAYVIVQQLHIRKTARAAFGKKHAATGFGIITSSIAATLACASCYSSVLAMFGLGGTLFIVEHRWWFAAFALGLSLASVYYGSRRIAGGCKTCTIAGR